MKKESICYFLALICFVTGCAHTSKNPLWIPSKSVSTSGFDLVLDAAPRQVSSIDYESFSDAIDEDIKQLSDLKAIVAFRVLHVYKGMNLTHKSTGSEPQGRTLNQIIQSTMNLELLRKFKKKNVRVDEGDLTSRWFRIGVIDPMMSFGIESWEQVEPTPYRLYFVKYQGQKDTFMLVKKEKLKREVKNLSEKADAS